MRNTNHALGLSLAGTVTVAALVAASLTSGPNSQVTGPVEPAAAEVTESPVAMLMTPGPAAQRGQVAASRTQDRELIAADDPTVLTVVDEPVVAVPAPAETDAVYVAPLGFTGVTPAPEPEPEPVVEPAPAQPAQEDAPALQESAQVTAEPSAQATVQAEPAPAPAPAPPATGGVLGIAASYVGSPYVLGGTTPGGFDCSGYTSYVFAQVGINLPRSAAAQQSYATPVSSPQPGDLVFWGYPAYHVGIYAGNGMVYDAGNPGTGVIYRSIFSGVSGYGRVG